MNHSEELSALISSIVDEILSYFFRARRLQSLLDEIITERVTKNIEVLIAREIENKIFKKSKALDLIYQDQIVENVNMNPLSEKFKPCYFSIVQKHLQDYVNDDLSGIKHDLCNSGTLLNQLRYIY